MSVEERRAEVVADLIRPLIEMDTIQTSLDTMPDSNQLMSETQWELEGGSYCPFFEKQHYNSWTDFLIACQYAYLISQIPKLKEQLEGKPFADAKECVDEILQKALTCRERPVLKYRLGLTDGNPHLLEEIASWYKVTPERIRVLVISSFRKIKKFCGGDYKLQGLE